MPSTDDIPQASRLHSELNNLNAAIALLQADGTVVSNLTIRGSPPVGGEMSMVTPNPPISDPATLQNLAAALQKQADALAQQLADMGYT